MNVKLTNMCMIFKDHEILVQNRTKKDWPGITFPGGKVEHGESIEQSVIREVKEETGLTVSNLTLHGMIQYELMHTDEKWIIFLYSTHTFEGELIQKENEDPCIFMDYEEMKTKPLSNDLEKYIKVYEEGYHEAYAYWDEDGMNSKGFQYFK